MDDVWWWLMDVILPVLLLIALIWLVFMRRSNRSDETTFKGTRAGYEEEEKLRREGTDDL